jgi:hypothetical protein
MAAAAGDEVGQILPKAAAGAGAQAGRLSPAGSEVIADLVAVVGSAATSRT